MADTVPCVEPTNTHSWFTYKYLTSVWWLVLIIPLGVLLVDRGQLATIIHFASAAFLSTLPYIVFAVVLIAWLKAAGAEATIARAFEGRERRMIIFAALFGGLAPFCSCEVIPFVAGLLAVGTPLSAIMAFWLASPLIDPPSLLITAGALGWPFAIGKAASAVGLGLFGGLVVSYITASGGFTKPARQVQATSCCSTTNPTMTAPLWKFWPDAERRTTFWQELIGNARFLVKWLLVAYLLEALLVTYVPASLIAGFVGGEGIGPIILAALVGMPAYLNSYIAPPLVAGLMEQGMSVGAAMAFMVAGAVSSIPAMAAVWSLVRTPVFFAYLGLGLLGAILSGQLMQWLL